jgi:Glycosyl hydrolase family 76
VSLHQADIQLQRASAAYDAMQHWLYIGGGRGLYRETAAPNSPVAYVWPYSRALLGTLCLAGIRGNQATYRAAVQDRINGLSRYWTGSAYASAIVPPGGDIYYDDNAWIALALVLAYRLALQERLERVKQLFTFASRAWDHERGGGVFWVQQGVGYGLSNNDRGAGATAGWGEVGLHLQELTGREEPMAVEMPHWVNRFLDASHAGRGPFLNVLRGDGSIDTNVWSYNQGVMLGARVLQYRLTPDTSYLHAAEAIARQTLETFGDFRNHPPSFNAMCFQNMLMLHAVTADAALQNDTLSAMRGYAEWAWDPVTGARDAATDLFYFDDAGRPALGAQPARVQDQGAMTQLYALLAWDLADYGKLT